MELLEAYLKSSSSRNGTTGFASISRLESHTDLPSFYELLNVSSVNANNSKLAELIVPLEETH